MSAVSDARDRRRRGRPPRRTRAAADGGSRQRLLTAARTEFARRGFAGANVDRIAVAAGVNKAMLYYHFTSKLTLYQEVLGEMFRAVAGRVHEVAASAAPPEAQLTRFVAAIADEAQARPHFPPIWFREIADGGAHLGDEAIQDVAAVLRTLGGILQAGVRARRFRRVNPLLVHSGIVAPLLLFFASMPLRRRLERAGMAGANALTRDEVVTHVQRVARAIVRGTR